MFCRWMVAYRCGGLSLGRTLLDVFWFAPLLLCCWGAQGACHAAAGLAGGGLQVMGAGAGALAAVVQACCAMQLAIAAARCLSPRT